MRSRIHAQIQTVLNSLESIALDMAEAVIVFFVARYLHRLVRKWLLPRLASARLTEADRSMIGVAVTIVFVIVSVTALLALWGVTWSGIIAAISLGTVGILLGVQDVLRSLIGGIFLVIEHPYSVGDRISVRDITGRVIGIDLRTTVLRSDDGYRIVTPNSIVFTDTMTNYSRQRQIRTSLVIGGIPGTARDARSAIEKAVAEIEGVEEAVEVRLRLHGIGASAPLRDRLNHVERKTSYRSIEARISWLGSGELAVKNAVIAKLRELYPKSVVRYATIAGAETPIVDDGRQQGGKRGG